MVAEKNKPAINIFAAILFSIVLIFGFFSNSDVVTYLIFIIFVVATILDTKNGIYLLILYVPHFEYLKVFPGTNLNFLLIISLVFFLKIFFDILLKKQIRINEMFKYITFISIFSIISLLINLSELELISSYYGMFFISILLFVSITRIIESNKELRFIYIMLILSAINVTLMLLPNVFISEDFFRGGRLTFAESVRLLGNTLAPAIIILFYKVQSIKNNIFYKIFIYILITILLFLILFTGSRGVFYSIIISVSIVQLVKLLKTKKILPFLTLLTGVIFLILTMTLLAKYNEEFSNTINRLLDIDRNIRLNIWSNALKQMSIRDYIFGRGLNNFAELSLKGGMISKYGEPYYAHSIYMDTLSSFGIIPFILLLYFLYIIIVGSINKKNLLNLTLVLFLIFSYFTHGQIINTFYWLLLGTVYIGFKITYNKGGEKR